MSSQDSRRRFLRSSVGASALAFTGSALAAATSTPSKAQASAAFEEGVKQKAARYARKGTYINYNENPLGPCEAAREAIQAVIPQSGRYRFDLMEELKHKVADSVGVGADNILLYPGSGWVLTLAPQAFASTSRGLVTADPGYEGCEDAARLNQIPIHKVALLADGAHDTKGMAAIRDAGLIYIANPNNPTGSITPRDAIKNLLQTKPKGTVVLVDEAYIHFSTQPSVIDLVKDFPDLIVTRTFSKLYGMAGLRCGFVVGQPQTLKKLVQQGTDFLPVTATVAALESLEQKGLVEKRRHYNAAVRRDVIAWLKQQGVDCTPSDSNCFMMHTGRPGADVAAAMAKLGVHVGRAWPSWPDWVRVSVGTPEDMAAFKRAFTQVQALKSLPKAEPVADQMRLCRAAALA